MRFSRIRYLVALIIGCAAGALIFIAQQPVELVGEGLWRLELYSYDFRMQHRHPLPPSDDIVLVCIDDLSLGRLPVWPWPRRYYAKAITNLKAAGARVIGVDVLFAGVTSKQAGEELSVTKPLDWEPPLSEDDKALAHAIAQAGNVVLAAHIAATRVQGGEKISGEFVSAEFPLADFEDAAAGLGVTDVPEDLDKCVRRYVSWVEHQDEKYPTFAVAIAALDQNLSVGEVMAEIGRQAKAHQHYLQQKYMLINYRAAPGHGFKQLSFYDVLYNKFAPAQVRGKIVLIGASAEIMHDTHYTPLSLRRGAQVKAQGQKMPGIEIHANALDTILNQRYLLPMPFTHTVLLTMALASLVAVLVGLLRPLWALVAGLPPVVIITVALTTYLMDGNRWMLLAAPVLSQIIAYIGMTTYLELTEERQRRRLYSAWGRRVSREVMEQILAQPERVAGKRLVATVMFTDLQGFTTFCHSNPPEKVVDTLNTYLSTVVRVIKQHGGTIDKFIGDGVMAVFDIPQPRPDHARRAVLAALEMQRQVAQLRENQPEGEWPIRMRVGIHTGELVAGEIGAQELLSYTVIGDTVSTASRLETLNKDYGTDIMISRTTFEAAGLATESLQGAVIKPLGAVQVRNRPAPIEVFAIQQAPTADE